MFSLPTKPIPFNSIYKHVFAFWRHTVRRTQIPALFFTVLMSFPYYLFLLHHHQANRKIEVFWLSAMPIVFCLIGLILFTMMVIQANTVRLNLPHVSYTSAFLVGVTKLPALILGLIITIVICIIGFAIFLVPGFYLFLLVPIYLQLVVLEKTNPFETLDETLDLVYGHWWRTVTTIFLPTLAFTIILGLIHFFVHTRFILSVENVSFDMGLIIPRIIFSAIYIPFFICLVLTQIHDLSIRNRGQA